MVAGSPHIAVAHSWPGQVAGSPTGYNRSVHKGLAGCTDFADYKGLLAAMVVVGRTLHRIGFPVQDFAPDLADSDSNS